MEPDSYPCAERMRAAIQRAAHQPHELRAALLQIAPLDRDDWFDRLLGLDGLPDDGAELPRGCAPYLPCAVDDLLSVIDLAAVSASDVFVDLGAGLGRASLLVHLLTGASTIGVEVQPALVAAARALAAELSIPRARTVLGDVAARAQDLAEGTVFFLYCPFSGPRFAEVLAALEPIARVRTIRVACVDLPLPPCSWLSLVGSSRPGLEVYTSATPLEPMG